MVRRGRQRPDIPDAAIDALFGLGYNVEQWKGELERQSYIWYPGLKDRIKGRQFLFFKEEIGRLLSAPPTRRADGTISNSCKSILEVLKGETGEKNQRLQNRRLFGPDSSNRTLEDKVKNWREEDPSYGLQTASNYAAQRDAITGDNFFAVWNDENPHSSKHGHRTRDMAIRSRLEVTEHTTPWPQPTLMGNGALLSDTPAYGYHNSINPSVHSIPGDLRVDYPNAHQHHFAKENTPTWDQDMAMTNSSLCYALVDAESIPHDQYLSERESVQPYCVEPHAAYPTNHASSSPNQSSPSGIGIDLWPDVSLPSSPQDSNTATISAKSAVTHIPHPPSYGQLHVGVTTGLPDEIAGQKDYCNSITLEDPETETFDNDNSDGRATQLLDQGSMPYVNDCQPPENDEMDGENTLQSAKFQRRMVPASQLSRMAKQAAQTYRARRKWPRGRVLRESGHRRKVLSLNSEVQRLKKDLKDTNLALEQKDSTLREKESALREEKSIRREKDAEILKLAERIKDLELREIHDREKVRLDAALARQKDAAKKANSHPPLNYFTEDDNENPPKRSRVMISNGPLALKLNASKTSLSLYPKIRPQVVASDCRDTIRMRTEPEASNRPSSRNREKSSEPSAKEFVKEHKSPKRSLTKKISDKFLGKKFDVAPPVPTPVPRPDPPPVPPKDHHAPTSLPAPPNNSRIEGDCATKRSTIATMDSGYHSLEMTSARNSVGFN